ncbi:hypothetical protein B0I35DRAFT_512918 [Stachybotrys elegans]|uniref:Fungal STAND N-terminal Goodbye domain-containing protein n=1 Tax=Stachybotrys elegans TaxID=80388 RepID=A0A8K0SVK1_9HYPO|nr:hypothetical protein B0I35DRAFT_512918 [Stachybotrys elegans]
MAAKRNGQTSVETRFAGILADAARTFKESSPKDSIDDFMKPPIRTVEDLMRVLDAQNNRFSDYRSKHEKITSVMSAALGPIEMVGEVLTGAASEAFPPAQNIFSAVVYLIGAAKDVSSTYDSIFALFDQLKDFTARLEVYVRGEMSTALRNKTIDILASLFNVLIIALKEVRQGRLRAYLRRLFGSESPVQPALAKLEALTVGEQRQVGADTYGEVLEINTKTDRVENTLIQMNENVLSLRAENLERANRTYKDQLWELLEPSPYPTDSYDAFNKSRVSGTGDWVLQDEGLSAWLEGETRYLWMTGNHGTGKSYLTARVISWCFDQKYRVGYFFFRDNNPETRSVIQALRSIAYQLSENDAFYAKKLLGSNFHADEIRTVPSAFRRLFQEPFQDFSAGPPMYIFLDGIDEADPAEIEQLLDLMALENGDDGILAESRVQFALIGRTHLSEKVTEQLDPLALGSIYTTIQVTTSRNADDVRAFIEDAIFSARIMSKMTTDFKHEVIEAIVQQADGLFILAKLMVAELHRKSRAQSILKSVREYPKETNAMLKQTLKNLMNTLSVEEAADLNEMLQWAVWAQETLTLAEMEEVLILKFTEPPIRLEEALRGPYACFFELEREDGLTTDDLIKDHERLQRQRNRDNSPSSDDRSGRRIRSAGNSPRNSTSNITIPRVNSPQSNPRASLPRLQTPTKSPSGSPKLGGNMARFQSPENSPSPRGISIPRGRVSSPQGRLSSDSRRGSNSRNQTPVRAFSPGSPTTWSDMMESDTEMEYSSNKDTTYATIFHSAVRQFFQSQSSLPTPVINDKPRIGFDNVEAKVHILKTCLRIFTEPSWYEGYGLGQNKSSIKQYAAWYWQEHIRDLDPTTASAEAKRDISSQVYRMLTDESIILEWTVLYEKNNEGLEVLSDANIGALRRWMSDASVLEVLSPEAKAWAQKATATPSGIVQPIGRLWAKAWLREDFEPTVPTKFCFEIVQTLAYMDSGKTWSDSECHWSDIPAGKRILKAVEWAACPADAHWHRRVGSTFLTLGLHKEALSYYQEALKLDGHDVKTMGRIAWCLFVDKQYDESLEKARLCAEIEEKYIAEGKHSAADLSRSKWRCYLDYLLIARCSYRLGRVDASLEYFQKAMKAGKTVVLQQSETFTAESSYLEVLAAENRHGDMLQVLEDLSADTAHAQAGPNRVVSFFLDQYNKTLLLDWIPKAASKADKVEALVGWLVTAIETAVMSQDYLKVLYLRLSCGMTYAYSGRTDEAIGTFEQISLSESRVNGNVPTRQGRAASFQRLAMLYKNRILQAGLKTEEAELWMDKLKRVQQKHNEQQTDNLPIRILGSDINIASVYLALFYRLSGQVAESKALLGALILESLDLLADQEPLNDEYALENLVRLFIAADDIENARALAQSMRKVNPRAGLQTPDASPRQHRREPKLPEIQSSNRACAHCLEIMSLSEAFSMCRLCMDSYCARCLEGVIKKPGNKTSDRRPDTVCKSDHEWFTVGTLDRILLRGEILFSDGRVRGFAEWKAELDEKWTV